MQYTHPLASLNTPFPSPGANLSQPPTAASGEARQAQSTSSRLHLKVTLGEGRLLFPFNRLGSVAGRGLVTFLKSDGWCCS